ncbi:hypothetical protein OHA79_47265 (plasmid) [Streptomyces sp. NBC_00841]|uniref:hypothetical protein n=1 Tax=unclassified Streptomyces TaxID=2593676 RepID=UPI0022534A21|nr:MULTISPECIES: hypothetical protein [unclassified Streptomyces]MCX4538014.1 hypothetical protein [Streptomyces sp. NBC_01669]WSA05190.1 hypothetical protein OHA79_47265 [Streptomyces sp. NBC_00841]
MGLSEGEDLANRAISNKAVTGIRRATGLVHGTRRVIVTMTRTAKDGTPQSVPERDLPPRTVVTAITPVLGLVVSTMPVLGRHCTLSPPGPDRP